MRTPNDLAKWKLRKLIRRRDGATWSSVQYLDKDELVAKCVGWLVVDSVTRNKIYI